MEKVVSLAYPCRDPLKSPPNSGRTLSLPLRRERKKMDEKTKQEDEKVQRELMDQEIQQNEEAAARKRARQAAEWKQKQEEASKPL